MRKSFLETWLCHYPAFGISANLYSGSRIACGGISSFCHPSLEKSLASYCSLQHYPSRRFSHLVIPYFYYMPCHTMIPQSLWARSPNRAFECGSAPSRQEVSPFDRSSAITWSSSIEVLLVIINPQLARCDILYISLRISSIT